MKKFILLTISILFVACQQPVDSIAIVKTDDDKTLVYDVSLQFQERLNIWVG